MPLNKIIQNGLVKSKTACSFVHEMVPAGVRESYTDRQMDFA